jgi:hypothetical protein
MSDFDDYDDDIDTDQDAWIVPLLYIIGGLAVAFLIVNNSGAVTETVAATVQSATTTTTDTTSTSSTEDTTE